jgi:sugar lactone lactonase YvrE
MKKLFTLFILFISHLINAQQVSTLFPNGSNIDDCLFISSDGTMYASSFDEGTVSKIVDGEISVFSDTLSNANGIAEDSQGFIYIADHNASKIFKFDTDGNGQLFSTGITRPSGVVAMPDNDTIIVTSYTQHKIYKVGADGIAHEFLNQSILNGPVSLNYDEDGFLFIANFNDGKILKYDHENDTLLLIADLNISNLGFMTFANGELFATSMNPPSKIVKITPETGEMVDFISNGSGYVDGDYSEAKFTTPNGIVASADQTKLFVSEYSPERVRMIDGITTSIAKHELALESVRIYPNPSTNKINIQFEERLNSPINYTIINLLGSQKLKGNAVSNQGLINIEHDLMQGIYFIDLETEQGSITKKFMVQK